MGRIIAIGDIHGCPAALEAVLGAIAPCPEDTIVTLGDYVDRGPDPRGVLDRLLAVQRGCRLVPLLGNHDQMMLLVCDGRWELLGDWRLFGGDTTLASYGGHVPDGVPAEHLDFLRSCRLVYETDRHFFVHAGYEADQPLDDQDRFIALWSSLKRRQPGPHYSGKIALVGHTRQKSGEVFDLGYLKCIDTDCYGHGWLTALDVESGQIWQADKTGKLRGK
ncbi:MAG: metallophosphoesterase family protein [Thermoguttaceae bacterium]